MATPNTRTNPSTASDMSSSSTSSNNTSTSSDLGSSANSSSSGMDGAPLREAREKITHVAEGIKSRATRMASDMSDRFGTSYDDASFWMRENYGKTLAVVGVLAAAGFAGYFLARRGRLSNGMRSDSYNPETPGRGDLHRGFEQSRGFERV